MYLKQVKCVIRKCLGQFDEELKEERLVFCSRYIFERERERERERAGEVGVKTFSLREQFFFDHVRRFQSGFLVKTPVFQLNFV